ncbi:hypothetical protein [Pelagibacterium montanilacus]|uniref:hypothetical protein n=1 Tax=Pelagibacterium montanilacus TaxID=2185280 RepID=UPI000F8F024F|nr:hypothetical protein [Pelagibacterium montanilacus]
MVPNIITPEHHTARAPGIADMFAEWLECHQLGFEDCSAEQEAQSTARYLELQEAIVSAVPVTAQELAMQLLAETDHGNSEWRPEWFLRVVDLAKGGEA